MTWYRNADARYPFLWEDAGQPPARWHGAGEGPVNYFADTPDGAWAEFLRHEEIDSLEDLAGISRAIWAVEIDVGEPTTPALPESDLLGDETSYGSCQADARIMRQLGSTSLVAPSAALLPGEASGWFVHDGEQRAEPARNGRVLVVFGAPNEKIVGWMLAADARPPVRLLDAVRHFGA